MVLVGHRTEDGIRLDQFDLGSEELVGIIRRYARGVLTDRGGWHLAIDVHGSGGFVDRREARGDDHGRRHAAEDEAEDLPALPAKDPEVVGERDGGLIGRLSVVTVTR